MTGKTHVIVGAAAGLAFARLLSAPAAFGITGLAAAAAGGAIGGALPDLDVRNTARPLQERLARWGAIALLVVAVGLDAAAGWPTARAATEAGLGPVAVGAAAIVALCCAARVSGHRSFSHSLLALAGFTAATLLACAPLAPFVGAGFASHLALDLLNRRPVRLLWPLSRGFCLGLCASGGVVDACLLVGGLLAGVRAVL